MSKDGYQVHVACHELLGHGTGKTIFRNEDGTQPSFTDPLTGETYESCYEKDDVWSTRFGQISSSYEECRADAVGFFLCTLPEVYSLFGIEEKQVDDLLWTNVMNHFRKGIVGLPLYNPDQNKWGQAHTQGAYVFAQWIYRNQKSKIVDFEILSETDFRIHLNKEALCGEGKELIRQLLVVLQTFKSSGSVERAEKFYNDYSQVPEMFLKIRDIVIKTKKPRFLNVFDNLTRYNTKSIEPVSYPANFQGICMSW